MTYTFKLSRRLARLRAPMFGLLVALFGCDGSDSFSPDPDESLDPVAGPSLAVSYAGGIPIGTFAQPTTQFGGTFNGAMLSIHSPYLLRELEDIRSRGGKVAVKLSGGDEYYKDAAGNFSLSKWKARVDLAKDVNFASYINDGTIIGHYLIDEPQDPANWNGRPISQATLEEMAKHSKDRWPAMTTIVRSSPDYLDNFDGTYRYLDAAWAQYAAHRWPNTEAFLEENVAKARAKGLALVVGLNLQDGGPSKSNMTASQVRSYGSTLLRSTYPCAFLSWKYSDDFMSAGGMWEAMKDLRNQAENRGFKTCRASAVGSGTPPPPPPPPPPPSGTGTLPFGLSYAPIDEYSARWTGTMYEAAPALLVERLRRAEGAGMKVVVTLVEASNAKNSDGTFSLSRWKAQLDRYRGLSLGRYVSSQALYLHHLVDQPRCGGCWGGRPVSYEAIEEMARYSKSIWPSLPTAVRVAPSNLAAASFRWTHLDAGWAQYNTRQGDLRTRLAREVGQAREEGLGLVAGLNLLHGAGFKTAPMTARQVKEFGSILAAAPSVCALVGWRYDTSYLGQTGMRDAMAAVATVARSRTAASCVRS
ncbi:MAG: hypothetical protein H0T68_08745 [Gemmatimonadales bacterium]|nr:hypothetical protein [Gemmatimonadales bacterium]